jgi:hypothetical protein
VTNGSGNYESTRQSALNWLGNGTFIGHFGCHTFGIRNLKAQLTVGNTDGEIMS